MIPVDEGLFLRPLALDDLDALLDLAQANREMPWLDWWMDREGNRALVETSMQQQRETGGMWAGIWFRGQLSGVLGLTGVNRWNRSARLDYWLGAAFQGQGLVTRAAAALLQYGFTELKLNRIQITCAVANGRSRAVAERLGFTPEGTLRQAERFNHRVHLETEFAPGGLSEPDESGNRYFDHAIYSLLRPEWQARLVTHTMDDGLS